MLSDPKCENDLDGLVEQFENATVLTPELVRRFITDAGTRLPALPKLEKAANLDRLIEARAWSDVAFALIEFELPAWSVRRIICEDGEWFCSLTRQPNLPLTLDDTADASHQLLPLAILGAFLEAQRKVNAVRNPAGVTVPQIQSSAGCAICCDNFA